MPLPENPHHVIVPVVSTTPATGRVHDLWGTGFFVAPGLLMSAKHVLGVTPEEGQALAAVWLQEPTPVALPIDDVYLDPAFDIAVARVSKWPVTGHLDLTGTEDLHMNRGVLTTEYSATEQRVPQSDGSTAMHIAANWHQGHIVREYGTEFGHQRLTRCLDVSYPAFKRASGAPVVHADNGEVLGMIVANVQRHLLPAHLERVEHPDGVVEELRYFLPNGQAIRAKHLRATLAVAVDVLGAS